MPGRLGAQGAVGRSELAYDTSTKVYPPLRDHNDVDSLVEALVDGTIDCIATDHAPHDAASKEVTYQDAAFGISVLETAFGSVMKLVHDGSMDLSTLIERMTAGPARVLGPGFAPLASLARGTPADLVIFDPAKEWMVDVSKFASKGRNTPLDGVSFKGQVLATIAAGEIVYMHEDFGAPNGG